MPSCATCGTLILFGGSTHENLRFCNDRCLSAYHESGAGLVHMIPPENIAQHAVDLHRSNCPECKGPGPVDIHQGYQIWSFLIATQWRSVPKLCCRGCARKHQLTSTGISAVAGWWGFPWGFLMTPLQIGRNVWAIIRGPDPSQPSQQLFQLSAAMLAAQIAENSQQVQLVPQPAQPTALGNQQTPTQASPQNKQNPYSYH